MPELEKYLQQLTDEGFAIIPEVLPAAEIERTKVVIDEVREQMTEEERQFWGLEAKVPPNTHFRDMTPEQIKALTLEERAVLNIPAF